MFLTFIISVAKVKVVFLRVAIAFNLAVKRSSRGEQLAYIAKKMVRHADSSHKRICIHCLTLSFRNRSREIKKKSLNCASSRLFNIGKNNYININGDIYHFLHSKFMKKKLHYHINSTLIFNIFLLLRNFKVQIIRLKKKKRELQTHNKIDTRNKYFTGKKYR